VSANSRSFVSSSAAVAGFAIGGLIVLRRR
jgi:hypothetical protein